MEVDIGVEERVWPSPLPPQQPPPPQQRHGQEEPVDHGLWHLITRDTRVEEGGVSAHHHARQNPPVLVVGVDDSVDAAVMCVSSDLNGSAARAKVVFQESILDGTRLEATSDCVDFVVGPHKARTDGRHQEDPEEHTESQGEPAAGDADSTPLLLYRFRVAELLKELADAACHTVDVFEYASGNEWVTHPSPKPLMIPFLMRELTAAHLTALVSVFFRADHLAGKRTRLIFNESRAPYLATRLLEYVYCRGRHSSLFKRILSADAHESLFCFEDHAEEPLRNFTLHHYSALTTSIKNLFRIEHTTFSTTDVHSAYLRSIIANDYHRHVIMRQIPSQIHYAVQLSASPSPFVQLPFSLFQPGDLSPPRAPVHIRGLCRRDCVGIHNIVREEMALLYAELQDDDMYEETALSALTSHLIFMLSDVAGHGQKRARIESAVQSLFGDDIIGISAHTVGDREKGTRTFLVIKVSLENVITEMGDDNAFNSPSNSLTHSVCTMPTIYNTLLAERLPLVAIFSPYSHVIGYSNGFCYAIKQCIVDMHSLNAECQTHYLDNLQHRKRRTLEAYQECPEYTEDVAQPRLSLGP